MSNLYFKYFDEKIISKSVSVVFKNNKKSLQGWRYMHIVHKFKSTISTVDVSKYPSAEKMSF